MRCSSICTPGQPFIDGVVKTSIYCDVCPGAIRGHTTGIVETRPGTLLLGVYASLRLPVYLCFYLAISEKNWIFYEFIFINMYPFRRNIP